MSKRQPPQSQGCRCDTTGLDWGAHAAAAVPDLFSFFFTLSWDADQQASTSLLSAGRHQRRIMCNYNRQSKTKPFTFNELHLEGKGRLPQGGILMKQMAECSQGPTLPVLLFAVCQHFQHSKEFHLSPHRSVCVECVGEPFCPSTRYRGSDQVAALSWPVASRSVPFALRHLQLCEAQLSIWAKRTNTAGRCPVCLILYFISSSTCAYWQCSFFCLPPFVTHATSHDSCESVSVCRVVRCIVPWVHIQPYLCSSLIAFPPPLPPPHFLCSMQKK